MHELGQGATWWPLKVATCPPSTPRQFEAVFQTCPTRQGLNLFVGGPRPETKRTDFMHNHALRAWTLGHVERVGSGCVVVGAGGEPGPALSETSFCLFANILLRISVFTMTKTKRGFTWIGSSGRVSDPFPSSLECSTESYSLFTVGAVLNFVWFD